MSKEIEKKDEIIEQKNNEIEELKKLTNNNFDKVTLCKELQKILTYLKKPFL